MKKDITRLVILEDNADDALLIKTTLNRSAAKYDIKLAADKESFIDTISSFDPQVILSDHRLPDFTSIEALEISKKILPFVPFILITGTVSEEYAAEIIKKGADDYLLKDRLTRLPAAIESALRQQQAEKDKFLAAEQLALSEEKYRTLFLKSPLPKWIYDTETLKFLDVNEAAIKHYGYTTQEFLNMTIRDIRPKEDIQKLLTNIRQIKDQSTVRHGNWVHLKKNGDSMIVETSAHSIEYGNKKARMVVANDITEKILAEEKLKKSEENYRTIMERVSDAFVALDKDWYYTYVNKKAGEIMRHDPDALIGKNIWTEFPEGIGQPFYKAYHQSMKEQIYIHLEEYYPPFDAWLENHIYPSPGGLSIFFRDITERKKAEQKILQSEENLKAIFENSSEAFILLDNKNRIKAFNNKASHVVLINSEKEMKAGMDILEFVEQERLPFFTNILENVLKGEMFQYDHSFPIKFGITTWINFSFNPVRKDKKIVGCCITARDITDKRIAEQQKEFDNNNLHALINNTRDMMWSVDRDFNLITSNQAFDGFVRSLTGNSIKKGGYVLNQAFTKDQLERFDDFYQRAFRGETFTILEFTAKPVHYWSEISFYPIYEKEKVIGTACFSRDITDQKKAEELLNQSFKEKKALAERVSAILNTLPANIALLDEKGVIVDVNDSWRNFADDNGFIGKNYAIGDNYIKASGQSKGNGKQVGKGIETVLRHTKREFVFEYSCHSPEEKRWFRMVVTPLLEKEYTGAVVMHIDISELRRLEDERIQHKIEEQRKISRAILHAQEKERNAIGIELHDNVNQILVGTNLMLSLVKADPEKNKKMIDSSMQYLQDAIQENRKIAHTFVAPDLDSESLAAQIEKLATNMLETAGISVHFDILHLDEDKLDSDRKFNIYRIAQEQCTNIVKYAKATGVNIKLTTTTANFRMTIADNGVGMDSNKKAKGIGLQNINGRLGLFNGKANIITAPGKGFSLEIIIPVN